MNDIDRDCAFRDVEACQRDGVLHRWRCVTVRLCARCAREILARMA